MRTDRPSTTLQIVTMPRTEPVACDGSYTCGCTDCIAERAKLVKLGVRRTTSRPVRRRAA